MDSDPRGAAPPPPPLGASKPSPLVIGSVLDGRYRILGDLGSGGFGLVYRAEHIKLNRPVAIKVLKEQYLYHESLRPRFEREAHALAALSHPNIVAITDYGIIDGRPYLVMEFLEGQTLRALMDDGTPTAERTLNIARQLLRGLAFAHERGLVHRDLKPGNVFLQNLPQQPDHVKVLDFGFAKFVDEDQKATALTKSGVAFGTPAYMSPEQASGGGTDARSDVYSVGILLYEMLTGCLPFDGELPDVVRMHLTAPVPSFAEARRDLVAAPELDKLFCKAMAKRPEERYQNAGELLAAIEALPDPPVRPAATRDETFISISPGPSIEEDISEHPSVGIGASILRVFVGLMLLSFLVVLGVVLFMMKGSEPGHDERVASGTSERAGDPTPVARADAAKVRVIAPIAPSIVYDASTADAYVVADVGTIVVDAAQDSGPHDAGSSSHSGDAAAVMELAGVTPEELAAAAAHEASAAASAKPAAVDPWGARPIPRLLARTRTRVRRGDNAPESTIRQLRDYSRDNRGVVRATLLIAQIYMKRGWRRDALERYDLAYRLDASSRGEPAMQRHMLELVQDNEVGARAEEAFARMYGAEGLAAVDAALASPNTSEAAKTRLRSVRARLTP